MSWPINSAISHPQIDARRALVQCSDLGSTLSIRTVLSSHFVSGNPTQRRPQGLRPVLEPRRPVEPGARVVSVALFFLSQTMMS